MDLTKGSLKKNMILFAVPLVLTSVLNRSFTFVDTIIVARFCSDTSLSAVALAGTLYSLFVSLINGFGAGCSIAVGKVFGRKDGALLKNAVRSLLALGGGASVLLAALCAAISRPYLVRSGTPAEVLDLTLRVLRAYAAGIPFYGFSLVASSLLNGLGDSKHTFQVYTISGALNILLDLIAVFAFDAGVMGCVIASLIAQGYSMAHLLWYLAARLGKICCRMRFERETARETLHIASTMIVQESLFNLLGVYVQSIVNPFGPAYINGYSIGRQICAIFSTAVNGYTRGYAAALSQNWGAGNMDRVREAATVSRRDGNWLCILLSALSVLLAGPLCRLMLPDAASEAVRFGAAYVLLSVPGYFASLHTQRVNYSLRVYGRNRTVLTGSLLAMAVKFLCVRPLSVLAVFLLPLAEPISKTAALGYLMAKQRKIEAEEGR